MRRLLVVSIVVSIVACFALALRAELRRPGSGLARARLRHGSLLLFIRAPGPSELAALTCRLPSGPVGVPGYCFPPGRARFDHVGPDEALCSYELPAPADCQLDLTNGAGDPRSYCIDRHGGFSDEPCEPTLRADPPARTTAVGIDRE